jgi:hypothetical protein
MPDDADALGGEFRCPLPPARAPGREDRSVPDPQEMKIRRMTPAIRFRDGIDPGRHCRPGVARRQRADDHAMPAA